MSSTCRKYDDQLVRTVSRYCHFTEEGSSFHADTCHMSRVGAFSPGTRETSSSLCCVEIFTHNRPNASVLGHEYSNTDLPSQTERRADQVTEPLDWFPSSLLSSFFLTSPLYPTPFPSQPLLPFLPAFSILSFFLVLLPFFYFLSSYSHSQRKSYSMHQTLFS